MKRFLDEPEMDLRARFIQLLLFDMIDRYPSCERKPDAEGAAFAGFTLSGDVTAKLLY